MGFTDIIKNSSCAKCHRGATVADIKKVETFLQVRLPKDYREFLIDCGWVRIGPDVVFGLGPQATKAVSMREVSKVERVLADPPMRSTLVPLMNDGAGNHFCLDTAKFDKGRCSVVFWEHDHPRGTMQRTKKVASTFEQWILELIEAQEELHR